MVMDAELTRFEKQVLQIAGLGVWQIVTGRPMKQRFVPTDDIRWNQNTGLFVTLNKKGAVRGSMGLLESTTTLAETLFDCAQTAATHDSRYPPVTPEELPELEVQVTLLSDIKRLKGPSDISVGKVGLILSRGQNQAVLLPHVATENNWSAEQFLEALCEKAQLSHKAWKDPNTLVEFFTSQILKGESLLKLIEEFV